MLGKHFGDGDDTTAHPKRIVSIRSRVGVGGQPAVEVMQPRDRGRDVALREGRERGVELRGRPKARNQVAKVIDVSADRQRGQKLRALQRFSLVWQCRG